MADILLQHVLVEGELHNVREFTGLPPDQRPEAFCPECRERVTLRLGRVRRAHAAHRSGSVCPAVQGETALHRAVKFHLARELQGRRFVRASVRCAGIGDFTFVPKGSCTKEFVWKFAKNWTRVELESQIDGLRPDIALFNGDTVLGAIEVAASHSTETEKANRYLELEIPWVEIQALPELVGKGGGWTINRPLPALWDEFGFRWRCEQCAHERSVHIATTADFEVSAWRIVDFYYKSGRCWRDRFEVRRVREGATIAAVMGCKASDPDDWNKIYPYPDGESVYFMKIEVDSYLDALSGKGAIVDSPMEWQSTPDPPDARDFEMYPRRYRKRASDGAWVLAPDLERVEWPVPTVHSEE